MRNRRLFAMLASPSVSLFSGGCGAVALYEGWKLNQRKRELLSLLHDAADICSATAQATVSTPRELCYRCEEPGGACISQGFSRPEVLSAAKLAAAAAGISQDELSLPQLAAGVAATEFFLTAQSTRTDKGSFVEKRTRESSLGRGPTASTDAASTATREKLEESHEPPGPVLSSPSLVGASGLTVGHVVSARVVRKPFEFSWAHGLKLPRRVLSIRYQYLVPYMLGEGEAKRELRTSQGSRIDSESEGVMHSPTLAIGGLLPRAASVPQKEDRGQSHAGPEDHGTSRVGVRDLSASAEAKQPRKSGNSGRAGVWSLLSRVDFWSHFSARPRRSSPELSGQNTDTPFSIYDGTLELRLPIGAVQPASNADAPSGPSFVAAKDQFESLEQMDKSSGPLAAAKEEPGHALPAPSPLRTSSAQTPGSRLSETDHSETHKAPATDTNGARLQRDGAFFSSVCGQCNEGFIAGGGNKRASTSPGEKGGVSAAGAVPARLKTVVDSWRLVHPQQLIIVSYERRDPEKHRAWVALVPRARRERDEPTARGTQEYPEELVVLQDDDVVRGDLMLFAGGALVFTGVLKSYMQLVLKKRSKLGIKAI